MHMPPCLTVYVTRINSYIFIEDGIFDGLNRQFYDKLTILVFFQRFTWFSDRHSSQPLQCSLFSGSWDVLEKHQFAVSGRGNCGKS